MRMHAIRADGRTEATPPQKKAQRKSVAPLVTPKMRALLMFGYAAASVSTAAM